MKKLFIFSKLSQAMTGIYTVIADNESSAREILKHDGHNPMLMELEISFNLAENENKDSIPYTMEVDNDSYEG